MGDDTIKKNISKNIGKYREASGMSQKELAKRLGVVPSRISNWETGANCPTIDILFEVCEILNVSINDIYGVYPNSKFVLEYDEMEHIKKYRFISAHSPDGANVVDTVLNREYYIAEHLQGKDNQIKELKKEYIPKRILAYYGKIAAAGTSVEFSDMIAGTKEYPITNESERADYTIGVNGDSMEPTYKDGDIIYVQKETHLNIGDIGIFQKDNGIYIKEVGENVLLSHNPEYESIKNDGNIICLGKVLGKVEE